MRVIKVSVSILFVACLSTWALWERELPTTYGQSKKISAKYWLGWNTFYCDCEFEDKKPNHKSCGYKPRKVTIRSSRVEWEHVVPASAFGRHRDCWAQGGRKNCLKTDPKFKTMYHDLWNLVPAIGEINNARSNYEFGVIAGEERKFGACDFEIHVHKRVVEPRPEIRGDVARIYLYMIRVYGSSEFPLSTASKEMFLGWSSEDPISDEERHRAQFVSGYQKVYPLVRE